MLVTFCSYHLQLFMSLVSTWRVEIAMRRMPKKFVCVRSWEVHTCQLPHAIQGISRSVKEKKISWISWISSPNFRLIICKAPPVQCSGSHINLIFKISPIRSHFPLKDVNRFSELQNVSLIDWNAFQKLSHLNGYLSTNRPMTCYSKNH